MDARERLRQVESVPSRQPPRRLEVQPDEHHARPGPPRDDQGPGFQFVRWAPRSVRRYADIVAGAQLLDERGRGLATKPARRSTDGLEAGGGEVRAQPRPVSACADERVDRAAHPEAPDRLGDDEQTVVPEDIKGGLARLGGAPQVLRRYRDPEQIGRA